MDAPIILIVDDEAQTRRLVHEHLAQRIRCRIIEAANGYEAIEQFQHNTIDLMLLDIKMPGISGIEVIQKASEQHKVFPIIVLSKFDSSQMAKQVAACGADYIPKPFSLKIVRSKVEEKLQSVGKFFPL